MSVPYRQLLRMAGLRVNAIPGAPQTARNAAYITSPLTITQLGSRDFPFAYIKDLCVATVGEIIEAYASVHNHPFRIYNAGQTNPLAHNAQIPSVDSAGKPVVGVYGAIKDASDGRPLTKQPKQLIQTIVDNTDAFLKNTYYYYDITGRLISHTRPNNVVIDVCVFSASDQLTALEADQAVPLPDASLSLAVDGLASKLIVDDEFIGQAQIFGNYYATGLQLIRQGEAVYTPAPVAQATADPRVS